MSPPPSPNAPRWNSEFHLVLPDDKRRRVLLLSDETGGYLPSLRVDRQLWVGNSHELIRLLREHLGLADNFIILRYLRMEMNPAERRVQAWLVLEPHSEWHELPLNGRWVNREVLAEEPLADKESQALLLDYLNGEAAGANVPLRAPWAEPGWFSRASHWMTETLIALGRNPTGPVQQFRNLGISSVLRVPTAAGLVYLKATAKLPLFINEGAFMAQLAEQFPGQIPRPIAIEAQQHWMLLDDFGADLRTQKPSEADVAKFLGQFGALQVQSAGMTDALRRAGCRDRRLAVLALQIADLAVHPLTARHTTPDEPSRLCAAVPGLQERCTILGRYNLPDCLVHGDLHLGNVARNGDRYQVFDWSDSCIAHPFVDMIEPYFFYDDAEIQGRLRDAYLSQWTQFEPMERLSEVWRLAKPLAALHQAVSYLHILIGQEELVHSEMADGLRDFVRLALTALTDDNAEIDTNAHILE
jgi:hypothetical protein